MSRSSEARRVPARMERFIKQLLIAYRAVVLYPPASHIPAENSQLAVATFASLLSGQHDVRFTVTKDGLYYHGTPVLPGKSAFNRFSRELYNHGLAEVRFHAGLTPETLLAFLSVLSRELEEIEGAEGFAAQLWEAGVDTITVSAAKRFAGDADDMYFESGLDVGPWPPDPADIDAALTAALDGIQPELALLVKVLRDAEVLAGYLEYGFSLAEPDTPCEEAVRGVRITGLAHLAHQMKGESGRQAMRTLSTAVSMLADPERRVLVSQRLLPEARIDAAVAELVVQVGIEDVCRMLISDVDASDVSIEGLGRAVRSLSLIGLASRGEVMGASGAIMRDAGIAQETVEAVLDVAAPRKLLMKGGPGAVTSDESPAQSVLRMIDLASGASADDADDPTNEALREETERGIGDADVMAALVTLVVSETSAEGLAETMLMLEEGLSLLVARGEYEVAADAAEALLGASAASDDERRALLADAVKALARRDQMQAITRALGLHPKGGPEHEACVRLLSTLGGLTIGPLLEILADESEMVVRKSIVEIISQIADDHIRELAERLGDPRWYFVRNTITILGATRRPEAVSALSRTVRHTDARVRRETIRALAGIQGPPAIELLAACLEDSDAGNVQLAARYLGSLEAHTALPALHRVALGEGTGNRDPGPRVEAVEAIGVIGAEESIPILRAVMGHGLWRPKRAKPLRGAAAAALKAIEAAEKG